MRFNRHSYMLVGALCVAHVLHSAVASDTTEGSSQREARDRIEDLVEQAERQAADDLPRASRTLKRAVAIHQSDAPSNTKALARILQAQAEIQILSRQFEQARQSLEKARRKWAELYSESDFRVARSDIALSEIEMLEQLTPDNQSRYLAAKQSGYAAQVAIKERRLQVSRDLLARVVADYRETCGQQSPFYADALQQLGYVGIELGDYRKSIGPLKSAQQIFASTTGTKTERYLLASSLLATAYRFVGDAAQAEAVSGSCMQICRQMYASSKSNGELLVEASLKHSSSLQEMGKHQLAAKTCIDALAIAEELWPQNEYPDGHWTIARLLHDAGTALVKSKRHHDAYPLLKRALQIELRLIQGDNHLVATTLNVLGLTENTLGRSEAAGNHLFQALQMRQRLYPKNLFPNGHHDITHSLGNVAEHHLTQGRLIDADNYARLTLQSALRLFPEENYSSGHPTLARAHSLLGRILFERGDLQAAGEQFIEALHIYQRLYPRERFPKGHLALAAAWQELGQVLVRQGNLEQSRSCFEKSFGIVSALFPTGAEPVKAQALSRMGSHCLNYGDVPRARSYFERATDLLRRAFPRETYPDGTPEMALALNGLAIADFHQRQLDEAEARLREAARISEAHGGTSFRHWLVRLNLASLLTEQEAFDEAKKLLTETLEQVDANQVTRSRWVAMFSLLHLTRIAAFETPETNEHIERLVELAEQLYNRRDFPNGHPDLFKAYHGAAFAYRCAGDFPQAAHWSREACRLRLEFLRHYIPVASEAQALNAAALLAPHVSSLLAATRHLPDAATATYHTVSQRRAIVYHLLAQRYALLRQHEELAGNQAFQRYRETRRTIARLVLTPSTGESELQEERRQRLNQLAREKEQAESTLAQNLPRELLVLRQANPERLIQQLDARSVYLDFHQYGVDDEEAKRYTVFLLAKDRPIQRIELGPQAPVDDALKRWRTAIAARNANGARQAAQQLRALLWDKIATCLPPGTETVFLTPDGFLHAMPWGALPGRSSAAPLLAEHAFVLVPDGEFLRRQLEDGPRPPASTDGTFLIVGGVDYDQKSPRNDGESPHRFALRGPPVREGRRAEWAALPGTQAEANAVASAAGPHESVVLLTHGEASTAQLLDALPQARRVHLATHGFFADPEFRSLMQLEAETFARHPFRWGERDGVTGRNPLALCGLVLAGANRPVELGPLGVPKGDGGILTGEGIATASLERLDLVTLSACQTGLGDVAGGEGQLGLQRAFHLAGADTVISSLWKVDDLATRELMTRFYQNLYEQRMSKKDALRQAQLSMLLEDPEFTLPRGLVRVPVKDPSRSAHTLLWAGWTISGDWR